MEDLFSPENLLTGLALLAGSAWTAIRANALYERARRLRLEKALAFIETAVLRVYETYVRAIKEARADGRLTDEERAQARRLAREQAISLARDEGADIVRAIGSACLDMWIERVVRRLKRR